MPKSRRQKISFTALRTVKKTVQVQFDTKQGKVSFPAVQKIKKPIRIEFYTKKLKK